MNYYIIKKVHSVNGAVTYTPIGYVFSEEDVTTIEDATIIADVRQWIGANYMALSDGTMDADDFFATQDFDFFYANDSTTTNIEGQGLYEITDFDNPEGVA